jgi:hypothetical protein
VLIVVTVFVVLAAIGVPTADYAWRRATAIAWVEQSGGVVQCESPPEWVPSRLAEYWPRWILSVEYLQIGPDASAEDLHRIEALRDATAVDLTNARVADAHLEHLNRFHRLERLYITSTAVTDRGLTSLARCGALTQLDLRDTSVTDEGLKSLTGLPLRSLKLINAKVTDAGIDNLRKLPQLDTLSLDGTLVSDAGVEKLKGLSLRSLSLGNTRVTDRGLEALGPMPDLQVLQLNKTAVGDRGLAAVGKWTNLIGLFLSETRISDAGLEHLSKLPLISLDVSHTDIGDAGLEHLSQQRRWMSLELGGTRITPAGAGQFADAHSLYLGISAPDEKITLSKYRQLAGRAPGSESAEP